MDYITVKLILVVAGLIGFGVWQLRDINHSLKESSEQKPSTRGAEIDRPKADD